MENSNCHYLVISYNHLGESNVNIHCLTLSFDEAMQNYTAVKSLKLGPLVELIQLSEPFNSIDGFTLFWGQPPAGIKIIESTNR